MDSDTLYIIPARGGSKGIPGKNIKPLCGKPLICYAIDNARALTADEHICLTTDSEEIRRVAEDYGLHVPFLRPQELATDTSATQEALIHALDFYRDRGREYKRIVLLQPTSPLRTPEDIRKCLDLYTGDIDMVVSVKPAATNPYYNAFETAPDGTLHISKGDGHYTRRQDAPQVWEYTGAVYVINADSLRRMPMSEFPRRLPSPTDPRKSIDLDTPLDWTIAETILSATNP